MKKFISVATMLLAFVVMASASVEDKFKEANNWYRAGNYEAAIEEYNSILSEGYFSAVLYYNLGNAYFRIDSLAAAILNYERALKLDPTNKDIEYNLEYANSRVQDRINPVPELFISKWANAFMGMFSITQWAVVSIVLVVILSFFLVLFFLSHSYTLRKLSFYFVLGAVLLLSVSIVSASVLNNRAKNVKQAIVTVPAVIMKSSPDENSTEKFIIHEGCKVTVEDSVGNWTKVRIGDGNTGWIENLNITNI